MKRGIELIAEERKRQIEDEGWTAKHDNMHRGYELSQAAATYLLTMLYPDGNNEKLWPWDVNYFKPTVKKHNRTEDDEIRQLVKAGALIAAEIDRLKRFKELIEKAENIGKHQTKGRFFNP